MAKLFRGQFNSDRFIVRDSLPLLSIVVPIYDRDVEILRLAGSIYEQTYPWLEVVFVLNGSPIQTKTAVHQATALLMKKRIKVCTLDYDMPFGSATIPRDLGIRASHGEFICVFDSDDWLNSEFFVFVNGGIKSDVLYYPKKVYHDHGRDMGYPFPFNTEVSGPEFLKSADAIEALKKSNFVGNSGAIFSREIFDKVGGIDPSLTYMEDLYLWLRFAKAGADIRLHKGVSNISLHPKNNEVSVQDSVKFRDVISLALGEDFDEFD